jgi:hypothetical protein
MTTAVDDLVAQAVVDQLVAANTAGRIVVPEGLEFRPVHSYAEWDQPFDSEQACELGKLYVDVVIEEQDLQVSASTKGRRSKYEIPIAIAVRRKFPQAQKDSVTGFVDLAAIKALKGMVQDIFEEFCIQRMQEFPAGAWQGTDLVANPSHEHLTGWQQFTSIVVVTFVVHKEAGVGA